MKTFWKSGDAFVWMTGGALATSLLMIVGLMALVSYNGVRQFWPSDVTELQLKDGSRILGEIWDREPIPAAHSDSLQIRHRIRVKIGNRDLYSLDFRWIDESMIARRVEPGHALVLERTEWGNFYGFFRALQFDGATVTDSFTKGWPALRRQLVNMARLRDEIDTIEKGEIGEINLGLEELRLDVRRVTLRKDTTDAAIAGYLAQKREEIRNLRARYDSSEAELGRLYRLSERAVLRMVSADGRETDIKVFDIVRAIRPNDVGFWDKSALCFSKLREFVAGEPRESNTEGGVFPALFGTVMLVVMMSIAVVPLGVLAAIYLREYAKQGFWVQAIRIAVNNLAGVPSIVYGVFGLGFFIYAVGGTIDRFFFSEALPTPTYGTGGLLWASLTLALLTVPVVIVATEEGLAAVPREIREGSLALSATKFETLWWVVIPSALPGILTGLILAIARAAGEVAPLMLTGVVKLAPDLPLDGTFPFLHLDRKFMHLGFHIYDVGFQSPNVEAAIPMVYSTTLLLIVIVVLLNVFAIQVRNRLRKKLAHSVF